MARLVLTDASPLIGLANVGGIEWLQALFPEVSMPERVRWEVLAGKPDRGKAQIRSALDEGWLNIWPGPVSRREFPNLDDNEAACISIGIAYPGEALILMDERAGRSVAIENDLRVAGTAAVIGMAKERGLIPSARKVFEELHQSDFRISAEVIRTVLTRVGELAD